MTVNDIIMYVMAAGVLLGGIDNLLGSPFGYGKKFQEGFMFLGVSALSMAGIICLAPVMAKMLKPLITPLFLMIGADPSMFASILALDMGGYPLAAELAREPLLGVYSGIIVASILGCTIVFVIPVGLGLLEKEDYGYFAKGLMIGLATMPVGTLTGGIMLKIPLPVLLCNNIPVLVLGMLLILGLNKAPDNMVKGFVAFGTGVKKVTIFGLMAGAFTCLTKIQVIPGLGRLEDAMDTVVSICIVLLGSLPIAFLIQKLLKKPFEKIGSKIGVNSAAIAGILIALVTTLPVFTMVKEMNPRGKIVTVAFCVAAGAVFGAHMGFAAGAQPQAVPALITAKLSAAICAAIAAVFYTRDKKML